MLLPDSRRNLIIRPCDEKPKSSLQPGTTKTISERKDEFQRLQKSPRRRLLQSFGESPSSERRLLLLLVLSDPEVIFNRFKASQAVPGAASGEIGANRPSSRASRRCLSFDVVDVRRGPHCSRQTRGGACSRCSGSPAALGTAWGARGRLEVGVCGSVGAAPAVGVFPSSFSSALIFVG